MSIKHVVEQGSNSVERPVKADLCPEFESDRIDMWTDLLAHYLDYIRRRNKPGVRKSCEKRADAEEMVGVAVGCVNRRQVLAARRDPIDQGDGLFHGEEGVDEDCVPLAGNESRRYRRKHSLFDAWRQVVGDNGDARRHD